MISIFFLLALTQADVSGLNEGESANLISAGPQLDSKTHLQGRIIDATTALPIQGATVETWAEEINPVFGGFFLFGTGTSGLDGRFSTTSSRGGERSEKLRITAPGYLTFSGTLDDVRGGISLFPAPEKPIRLRFVDMQGMPIQGARITSTYSCAHDVPAFEVLTDHAGVAELPTFGLQDNMPELRVRAPGFHGIKYLLVDEALVWGDMEGCPFVVLARCEPASFVLLDDSGEPWVGASLHIQDGDGFRVVKTGREGFFQLDSRFDGKYISLRLLDGEASRSLTSVLPQLGETVVIRPDAMDWGESVPTGTMQLDFQGEAESFVYHEDGWILEGCPSAGTFLFPAGKGRIVIGGTFS